MRAAIILGICALTAALMLFAAAPLLDPATTERLAGADGPRGAEQPDFTQERDALRSKISDLEATLAQDRPDTGELDALRETVARIEADRTALEADKARLLGEAADLGRAAAGLERAKAEAEADLVEVRTAYARSQDDVRRLRVETEEERAAAAAMREEITLSREQVVALETEIVAAAQRIAALEARAAASAQEIAALEERNAAASARIAEMQARSEQSEQSGDARVAAMQARLDAQAGDLAAALERVGALAEAATEREATLAALSRQKAEDRAEIAALTETLSERDARIDQLQSSEGMRILSSLAMCRERTRGAFDAARVEFEGGSATISPAGAAALEAFAGIAASCVADGLALQIEGYADTGGGSATGLLLSTARSKAVEQALAGHGLPDGAMRSVGFGQRDSAPDQADGTANAPTIIFDWKMQ